MAFDFRLTIHFTLPGACIAGIYGLWNIYNFAVLVLYAPSSQTLAARSTFEVSEAETSENGARFADTQRFITHQVNSDASLIYSIAGKGNVE